MRLRSFTYFINCVSSTAELITDMVDQAKDVGWRTLIRHIDFKDIARLFPFYDWKGYGNDLHIKDDWSVKLYRSKYNGQRCYYIYHSAFEYVFIEQ